MLVQGRWLRQRGRRSRLMERSRPRCEDSHEHFWCRRLVSQRRVGPDRVVVASPAFDDDLGLAQSVEDLSIEQLIAKACIEALDVAVTPQRMCGAVVRAWPKAAASCRAGLAVTKRDGSRNCSRRLISLFRRCLFQLRSERHFTGFPSACRQNS